MYPYTSTSVRAKKKYRQKLRKELRRKKKNKKMLVPVTSTPSINYPKQNLDFFP